MKTAENRPKLTGPQLATLTAIITGDHMNIHTAPQRAKTDLYKKGLIAAVPPEENAARWVPTCEGADVYAAITSPPPSAATAAGRPRKFRTAAEKQKAYRERKFFKVISETADN